MAIPEWAKEMRRKNTEVREIKGKYYLYEVHCKYNKETKKRKKTTPVYLGRLVEDKGLIEKGTRAVTVKTVVAKPMANVEYGVSATIETLMAEEIAALKKHYPECWNTLLGMAYCRLVYQSPIKDMDQHWTRSFLSTALPGTHMSADYISKLIRQCGKDRETINRYFGEFKSIGEVIALDGTDEETASKKITDARLSKTKRGNFGMVLNIMMIFSIGLNKPMFYRILRGNIKDVKSFITCLKEYGGKDLSDIIIIVDKGFYSSKNIEELDELGVNYVMPLKRDNSMIDYTPAMVDYLIDGGEAMQYHGRTVFTYKQKCDDKHNVTLCVDTDDREVEAKAFRERIGSNMLKEEQHRNQKYTWEKYKEQRPHMGTIAFLTSSKLSVSHFGKDGKQEVDENKVPIKSSATGPDIYRLYKKRGLIEQQIDVFKNVLDADCTYMQDRDALEGWMFTNFIALQWYYEILNKLDTVPELESSYSVETVVRLLTDVRKVLLNGEWCSDAMTNKESHAVSALGIDLEHTLCIP